MSWGSIPFDITELREFRIKGLQIGGNKKGHRSSDFHADNQRRRKSSKAFFDTRDEQRGRQRWHSRPRVQGFVPDDDSDRELSPESQRCPERAKLTRQEKAFSDFKASSSPKCFCGEKAHKVTTKGYGGGAYYQCHNMGKDRSAIPPSSTYSYLTKTRHNQPSHCQFTACDMHQQPLDGKPPQPLTFPPPGRKPAVVVEDDHHAANSNGLEICHFHMHHDAWELCKRQIDSVDSVLDNNIITSCPWSNYTFLVLFRVHNKACAVPAAPDTIQCSCNNELRFKYDQDAEEWVWECKDIFNQGVKPKCGFSQAANQTRIEVPSDWFPHESLCKDVTKVDSDRFKTADSTQSARDNVSSAMQQSEDGTNYGFSTRNKPYKSSRDACDAFVKYEIGRLRSKLHYALESHIRGVENVLTKACGDTRDHMATRLLEAADKHDALAKENSEMRAELEKLCNITKAQEERIGDLEQQVIWTEVAGQQRLRAQRHDALMKRDKRLPNGKTERCRVCEVGEIEVAFEGCWHMATCEGCASNCDRCPICRRKKITLRQVYYG